MAINHGLWLPLGPSACKADMLTAMLWKHVLIAYSWRWGRHWILRKRLTIGITAVLKMWPQTFLSVSTWIYFPTGPACQRNSSLDPRGKALQHLVIIASSTIECTETRFDHSETIHLIKQANMSKCLCFFLHLNCAYINITASILLQKGALEPKSPVHRMNPALLLRASQKEPSFKQAHLFTKSVFSNHPYWVHFTDQALWSVLHSVSFNLYNYPTS